MMTAKQRRLLARMGGMVNHAQGDAVVEEVANVQVIRDGSLVKVNQGAYNPSFVAQFQLQVIPYYFTVAAGVYTNIAAAALNATLKVKLPFFLFGNIDFASGYPIAKGLFPISNWAYNPRVVFGATDRPGDIFSVWDTNVTSLLQDGDLVFVYTAVAGGTNYLALKIVRSLDVGFATLLQATNSNLFGTNMVRYSAFSQAAVDIAQFQNPFKCVDLTMFGKFTQDTVNPKSFKNPEQQQTDIIDIDFEFRVSKQKLIGSYFNFDAGTIDLNMFVAYADKIQ